MYLPEFDHEFAETRRALERVPGDRLDWKPHEKSFTLGALATHLAEIPTWMAVTLSQETFDLDQPYERPELTSPDDILAHFDETVREARAVLEKATGDDLMQTWSMTKGDEVVMAMPRAAVLRSFILNHNVHHRAQLGLYLRLLDVDVPGHYGPSADESM